MTPGQAQQAIRDFPDRIVINNQLNHWARTIYFGANAPWDDVRVRKAIHLALDRDQWLAFYRIPGYEGMKLAHTMAPGTFYAPTDEEIRTWPGYRQPKDEDIRGQPVDGRGVWSREPSHCRVHGDYHEPV